MKHTLTDVGAGLSSAPVSFSAKTGTVIVPHNAACKDKHRGGEWRKCRCPKALLVSSTSSSLGPL
jgi:hypothetical protein